VVQAFVERQRLASAGVLVVVGENEAPVAQAQHVELDHVDVVRERSLEAGDGVAGRDQVRSLVTDALHRWHPGHQYVVRLSSPWPRAWIFVPQRGHGVPARL
jgi:hypothetical protein